MSAGGTLAAGSLSLSQIDVERLAVRVDEAARNRCAITKITDDYPEMTWADAYAVQERLREKFEERGEETGLLFKAGLTSHAKMEQMGVTEPVFGFLSSKGRYAAGDEVLCSQYIHPRIEAEIALTTSSELSGPDCTVEDVMEAIGEAASAIEIIDSRYIDFKFDLKSVIADNTSAAGWALGKLKPVDFSLDLPNLNLRLRINGKEVAAVKGEAVLGNPACSVAMLVNHLHSLGRTLPKGSVILTGGASAAFGVEPGDRIELEVDQLGPLTLRFV